MFFKQFTHWDGAHDKPCKKQKKRDKKKNASTRKIPFIRTEYIQRRSVRKKKIKYGTENEH